VADGNPAPVREIHGEHFRCERRQRQQTEDAHARGIERGQRPEQKRCATAKSHRHHEDGMGCRQAPGPRPAVGRRTWLPYADETLSPPPDAKIGGRIWDASKAICHRFRTVIAPTALSTSCVTASAATSAAPGT